MDTSKEYIKQCDCPEIQKVCYLLGQSGHDFFYDSQKGVYRGFSTASSIWLPAQDQIQEMFKWEVVRLAEQLYHFLDRQICYSRTDNYSNSMEQLWLAFYMFENHQKIWDSKKEQWVKSVKE